MYFIFLGPQANEVLKSFLQSQGTVENFILNSDKALTDGQKAIAGRVECPTVREKGVLCKAL